LNEAELKDKSANGTSASVWPGWMRRSLRGAEELPVHLSTLKAGFFPSAQTRLEIALLAGGPHRGMEYRSEANDSGFSGVSTGTASGLDRCATGALLAGGGIPRVVHA
jgi:hypothetical protein